MGRFDNLKDNSFSSNTNRKEIRNKIPENNERRDDRRKYDRRKDNNIFKEKIKKDFSTCNENFPILGSEVIPDIKNKIKKEESNWLKAIETQNILLVNEDIFIIDSNKSKYWKGAQWAGPVMSRQSSSLHKNKNTEISSTINPSLGIEYSIDGKNWHTSLNDTFSQEQLQAMEDEENDKLIHRWSNWIEHTYHKQKQESDQYFYETGEMDGFAIAESNITAYEIYTEQFETMTKDEIELDEEEYEDLEDNLN